MAQFSKDQQSGQIVIMGLLVMVAVLAIALSVVSQSMNGISTATKTEDSSRAFSAAQGGVEQALSGTGGSGATFGNGAQAGVTTFSLPGSGLALLYPDIDKTSYAQFWFVDPSSLLMPPPQSYFSGSFDIYFGNPTPAAGDNPAIEIRLIYYNTGTSSYATKTVLVDSTSRTPANSFILASCGGQHTTVDTGQDKLFLCKQTINLNAALGYPIMARVRVLYSNSKQPIALQPTGGSLPPQADLITSAGTAGNVQRVVQVFQQKYVMPPFFDYVLFSGGTLSKS